MTTPCPDENTFLAFIDGDLPKDHAQELEAHIDQCPVCSELFVELGHLMLGQTEDDPNSQPQVMAQSPKTLGRYHLKRIVGAGGMGVVYEATDPELQRKVAIKIIRPDKFDDLQDQRRARLKREARALAALTHPNVLTVYDVGEDEARIWIAMEFIDGQPISDWIASERPSWQDILDVYKRAGKGLAAAHEHGLVHRDIKPDNVLISKDDRVLLMDFGLAAQDELPSQSRVLTTDDPLTVTGVIVGTPLYMSPEQLAGQKLDPLSDQFSFCVSVFEGLYGFRPFSGHTLQDLTAAVNSGQLIRPRTKDIPDALFDVLERGMSPRPAERFEDMQALLSALEHAAKYVAPPTKTKDSTVKPWMIAVPAVVLGLVGAFALGKSNQIDLTSPKLEPKQPTTQTTPKQTTKPKIQPKSAPLTLPISPAKLAINKATQTATRQLKQDSPPVSRSKNTSATKPSKSKTTRKKTTKKAAMVAKNNTKDSSAKPPSKTMANQGAAKTTPNHVGPPINHNPPKVVHGANFTEAKRQKVKAFHNALARSYIPACQGLQGYSRCSWAIKKVRAEVGKYKAGAYLDDLLQSGANPNSVNILKGTLQGFYNLASDQALQADECKVAYEMRISQIKTWAHGGKPGSHKYKTGRNVSFWKSQIEKKNANCQGKL